MKRRSAYRTFLAVSLLAFIVIVIGELVFSPASEPQSWINQMIGFALVAIGIGLAVTVAWLGRHVRRSYR